MAELVERQPRRLFAFGCSFTKYYWGCTWPEIISRDLNIPVYNYGLSGAGNQYIANMVAQADALYDFDEGDLIMVEWTNVCREDRWRKHKWEVSGNIFTSNLLGDSFVKDWADPVGYLIRDLASIKFVTALLKSKGCQFHLLSMNNIIEEFDQNSNLKLDRNYAYEHTKLKSMYHNELKLIHPSFYETLWENDMWNKKLRPEQNFFDDYYSDGHPSPIEHLTFLQKTFTDHVFKDETIDVVKSAQRGYISYIRLLIATYRKQFAIYDLTAEEHKELLKRTTIAFLSRTDKL
jgi:hypothetical protein